MWLALLHRLPFGFGFDAFVTVGLVNDLCRSAEQAEAQENGLHFPAEIAKILIDPGHLPTAWNLRVTFRSAVPKASIMRLVKLNRS